MDTKLLWSRRGNNSCFLLDVHSATHIFKIYEIYPIKYNSSIRQVLIRAMMYIYMDKYNKWANGCCLTPNTSPISCRKQVIVDEMVMLSAWTRPTCFV
jgi:hypothetical protein